MDRKAFWTDELKDFVRVHGPSTPDAELAAAITVATGCRVTAESVRAQRMKMGVASGRPRGRPRKS